MDPRIIEALGRLDIPTEGLTPAHRLRDDLGMDSAETVDLVANLEQMCGCRFPDDGNLATSLVTVADVLRLLRDEPEPVS